MLGSATFTIVVSRITMKKPMHATGTARGRPAVRVTTDDRTSLSRQLTP
jgi:hypothetical protein